MKTLFYSLLLLYSVAGYSFPKVGESTGAGGNALVCRNTAGAITSARMLDLYEGEILYGLEFNELQVDIEEKLKELSKNSAIGGHGVPTLTDIFI